ncbi:hypothetical protein I4I73_21320 [Pseudonocardia sp. KRD-184]|uniref:Uncharacterized protein n=1 Tax=Pseudonocardia oceani TaxID=2792013 RepID=A0ABS6UFW8_9PSEU|nr:hypothetical protein [Pseudonocardia oceani]MBW0090515.1 hypothetical protein [Pseudonocardia oceani]MBW0098532.1 hypothetical protein [Pseudonocardia oceani]MBW0124372.1 hypothetical protein [Pseudonocardia oceani]MBW0131142.1 hypothetical protein [Pseudonocardia oceani]MBW0132596.1 hypothetical protein [Pseudonocardia oceani]
MSTLKALGIPLLIRTACRTISAMTHPLIVAGLLLGGLWLVLAWGNEWVEQRQEEQWRVVVEHTEALERRSALQEQVDWEVRQHQLDPSYPYPEQVPVCPPWQEPWVLSVSVAGDVDARCQ